MSQFRELIESIIKEDEELFTVRYNVESGIPTASDIITLNDESIKNDFEAVKKAIENKEYTTYNKGTQFPKEVAMQIVDTFGQDGHWGSEDCYWASPKEGATLPTSWAADKVKAPITPKEEPIPEECPWCHEKIEKPWKDTIFFGSQAKDMVFCSRKCAVHYQMSHDRD